MLSKDELQMELDRLNTEHEYRAKVRLSFYLLALITGGKNGADMNARFQEAFADAMESDLKLDDLGYSEERKQLIIQVERLNGKLRAFEELRAETPEVIVVGEGS